MRAALLIAGMAALAGCAAGANTGAGQDARAEQALASALAGRSAGEPRDCISASQTDGPQIIDRDTLIYRDGATLWRNELPAACPGLAPVTTVIAEVHGGQLCRNDRFRVVEPGATIPGPYCRLGRFVPYRRN